LTRRWSESSMAKTHGLRPVSSRIAKPSWNGLRDEAPSRQRVEVLGPGLISLASRRYIEVRRFDKWPARWEQGSPVVGEDFLREMDNSLHGRPTQLTARWPSTSPRPVSDFCNCCRSALRRPDPVLPNIQRAVSAA
jgi:hypothetical protein